MSPEAHLLSRQGHIEGVAPHEADPPPVLEPLNGVPCTAGELSGAIRGMPGKCGWQLWVHAGGPSSDYRKKQMSAAAADPYCLRQDKGQPTCAEDARAVCASAPVQHSAAGEVAAQAQQPGPTKQLLLIPCRPLMASGVRCQPVKEHSTMLPCCAWHTACLPGQLPWMPQSLMAPQQCCCVPPTICALNHISMQRCCHRGSQSSRVWLNKHPRT